MAESCIPDSAMHRPHQQNSESCAVVQDAALAFCREHGLDKGIAGPLARHIQGNLDRANQDALAQVGAACAYLNLCSGSAALPVLEAYAQTMLP